VDVAPVEEGSCGLSEWGCEGLRRERMVANMGVSVYMESYARARERVTT
jgi:hypothetical protein